MINYWLIVHDYWILTGRQTSRYHLMPGKTSPGPISWFPVASKGQPTHPQSARRRGKSLHHPYDLREGTKPGKISWTNGSKNMVLWWYRKIVFIPKYGNNRFWRILISRNVYESIHIPLSEACQRPSNHWTFSEGTRSSRLTKVSVCDVLRYSRKIGRASCRERV